MNKLTEEIFEIASTPEARDKLESVFSKYIVARIEEGKALTRALNAALLDVYREIKENNEQTETHKNPPTPPPIRRIKEGSDKPERE